MTLLLASASPRRAELLRAAGFTFEVLAVDVDERVVPGELPADYVRRLAQEKSARALDELSSDVRSTAGARTPFPPTLVLLGADTAVVVDGEIFGKPRDDAEAAAMLRRLSGRAHEVWTGLSVRSRTLDLVRVEVTTVTFTTLSDADVSFCLAGGEGRDKAGAYAIQGRASRFIPSIRGSYSNVVGLPVAAVHALLVEIASREPSGYSVG
jgi:septum formation protein